VDVDVVVLRVAEDVEDLRPVEVDAAARRPVGRASNPTTTPPALPAGASWMWAAVAGAMPLTTSS
jgi:hypothetical protein